MLGLCGGPEELERTSLEATYVSKLWMGLFVGLRVERLARKIAASRAFSGPMRCGRAPS